MRLFIILGVLAAAFAQIDTTNSNAPRDGSYGQPRRLPKRDNAIRDDAHLSASRSIEKRDATGRCPGGQTPVSNGIPPTPNGCGPKDFEGAVPELWFNKCCGNHDVCYGDCPKSKTDCDNAFALCLKTACETEFAWWNPGRAPCYYAATAYYTAVNVGGQGSFEGGTKNHCTCV
ncbi:hypothetical protein CcaverHIS002_0500240 [Cutaneotrichosporon cavernicola]|uniref:Phospholipase A2 n=1 Tax=Cutaneotrichosporon cavernicola TaxID=279322 RepID=A0AA48L7W7_9TREE|nr:uncharacterized protein CcaverHIS019_0600240 [Cutaneotrichosporon cavernicola]BEI84623.1 hypothetical protein CcaverHIS002_0500240 [Cutaneotrichosporon cavernicola]BEI93565.1 hypothetical protein CcaverHIS019_0600240 [Cutaneotrichosporon cavernicola]BEJ01342.1 hypothetical protein CcaverHIS631_0600240 [Cutaneotrichosporon cavernicola]BEJ09109.1 hypothetical protein CcaverHIS641_0600240 [Cutaneotrichosporon cavernicola]